MSIFDLFSRHGQRRGSRHHSNGYGYLPAAQPAQAQSACRACGAGNAIDARFCNQCGQRVGPLPCPSCAQPLGPGARFCSSCGTAAA